MEYGVQGRRNVKNLGWDKPISNQVRVVAVSLPQLTQASFLQ